MFYQNKLRFVENYFELLAQFFVQPSDKLKSEEQIRNEEQQRLQKLEEERLNRMKRTVDATPEDQDEPPHKKHQSADDLDDG